MEHKPQEESSLVLGAGAAPAGAEAGPTPSVDDTLAATDVEKNDQVKSAGPADEDRYVTGFKLVSIFCGMMLS